MALKVSDMWSSLCRDCGPSDAEPVRPDDAGRSIVACLGPRLARQAENSSQDDQGAPTEMKASARLKMANDQTGVWNST